MPGYNGKEVVLKVGNGGIPELFSIVGGLQATLLNLSCGGREAGNVQSGPWRIVADASGTLQLSIAGNGVFFDSAAEARIQQLAFSGSVANYELSFGNGDIVSGSFLITEYERLGEYGREERYAIRLESAGLLTYQATQ